MDHVLVDAAHRAKVHRVRLRTRPQVPCVVGEARRRGRKERQEGEAGRTEDEKKRQEEDERRTEDEKKKTE